MDPRDSPRESLRDSPEAAVDPKNVTLEFGATDGDGGEGDAAKGDDTESDEASGSTSDSSDEGLFHAAGQQEP